jgi:uncharacterized protein (TIGR02808 family)
VSIFVSKQGVFMSELESIIWHVLGYSSMPFIFIGGFVGVFLVTAGVLKLTGNHPVED